MNYYSVNMTRQSLVLDLDAEREVGVSTEGVFCPDPVLVRDRNWSKSPTPEKVVFLLLFFLRAFLQCISQECSFG